MKIQLLSTAGAKYLGFAKNKFRLLQDQRLDVKLPALSRTYTLLDEGIRIDLFSSEGANWIRISGGGIAPQIILSSGTNFAQYNYYDDKLRNIVSFDTAKSGNLVPAYNGRSETDTWQFTYSSKWANSETPNAGSWLGGIDSYELSIFYQGSTIYGKQGDTVGALAIVPHTFVPEYSANYGSLFGLASLYDSTPWNLHQGLTLFTLAAQNQSFVDSWYWTPSFFFAAPANPDELFVGGYYGSYPVSEYGLTSNEFGTFYETLVAATVKFKGLVDRRYSGGLYQYGWCEHVTYVETALGVEESNDLYFYFSPDVLASATTNTFSNYTYSGITSNATITVGTDLQGFERSHKMKAPFEDFDLDMWNLNAYNPTTGAVGILMVSGSNAILYRFSSGMSEVYSTSNYHSHSRSKDGAIVAIFEGSGIIENVVVFDLYGTREGEKDGEDYTSGGYTQIVSSSIVASVEAITGCLIPYRADSFTPQELPYDLATATPSTASIDIVQRPALALVRFNKIAAAGGVIHKITCEDGVTANFSVSPDECANNTYILEHNSSSREKFVGDVDVGGGLVFSVRGDFSGTGSSIGFTGVGEGETTTVERPDTFTLLVDGAGGITTQPYSYIGELQAGDCIDVDESGSWTVDTVNCDAGCTGEIEVTATTSCGQTGTGLYTVTIDPLTLSTTGTIDVAKYDIFSASGGVPPYEFSFEGGTICNVDSGCTDGVDTFVKGEIMGFDSCSSGDSMVGRITVTDSCLNEDFIDVRLPFGLWVDDNNDVYFPCAGGASYCTAGVPNNASHIGVVSEGDFVREFEYVCVWLSGAVGTGLDDCVICRNVAAKTCHMNSYYSKVRSNINHQTLITTPDTGNYVGYAIVRYGSFSMSWKCP